jgi:hypothetical protein
MKWLAIVLLLLAAAAIGLGVLRVHVTADSNAFGQLVSPGRLSPAHASLNNRCSACHTPGKGVEAVNCVVCHANDRNLLQRQPTAFHANITRCAECHVEHRGFSVRPVTMDHSALAQIGLRELESSAPGSEALLISRAAKESIAGARPLLGSNDALTSTLNCANCHSSQDPHSGLFGRDCAQCHVTAQWSIAGYRHPSARSLDCAQCHQAPPSHYMEHFEMISMRIAGVEHAKVNECYRCHQTTSWNDIRGIGWYKHH